MDGFTTCWRRGHFDRRSLCKKTTEGRQNGSFILDSDRLVMMKKLADTTFHLPLLHDPHNLFRWLLVGKQHIDLTDIA